MAQQSETIGHRCQTTMERNWNTIDDYISISQGTDLFMDVNFPTDDALYWADSNEIGDMSSLTPQVEWKRISDPSFPATSFWGPNGTNSISVQDINQGYIGNCWIMAAISALAEVPSRVDNIMISDDFEDAGIYAMNMYSLGVPYTQIVDDYMPMWLDSNDTVFAGVGKDGSAWGAVVEKMFAKFYGNYEHIIGGWMVYAVAALNGSPFSEMTHAGADKQAIWNYVDTANQDTDIITAGSNFCGSDSQTTYQGVACSHAYTVIHSATITRTDGTSVQLMQVRNPWGSEQYSGPWSDNWSGWTSHDIDAVNAAFTGNGGTGHEVSGNGLFFIDLDSYMVNFSTTQINQDTSNWALKYFLMHDDPNDLENKAAAECTGCVKHQINITNTGSS